MRNLFATILLRNIKQNVYDIKKLNQAQNGMDITSR